MKHSDFYKTDILIRYLGKETSTAENKTVEDWCEESRQNKDYFLKIKELWDGSGDQDLLNEKYRPKDVFEKLFSKPDKISKIRILIVKRLAAASITLFLALGLFGYHLWHTRELEFTSDQKISNIILKDNTKVWLNKNSTLTYTKNHRKKRMVRLSGEAYFEVSHNPGRPFIILTSNSRITVLGTKFNVRAYPGESGTEVAVISGVVNINHLSVPPARQNDLRLSAGEKGIINNIDSIPVKDTIYDLNYISWKTRDFVFNNTNLREIVELANSIYNVNIEIQSANVEHCNLTGSFKCQSIDEMLDMLRFVLGVTVERKGETIYLKSDSCLVSE